MHVFQVKGLSGILMLLLAIIGALLILFVLPGTFMMVFWNATVFEGLKGPEIDLGQGLILWMAIMAVIKVVMKPDVQLQFYTPPKTSFDNQKNEKEK